MLIFYAFMLEYFRQFTFFDKCTSFETINEPIVAIQLPEVRFLNDFLGESYSFAAMVTRVRGTDSLYKELLAWIPTINGGIKITYDPLHHLFAFEANVQHGSAEEFQREREKPLQILKSETKRLLGQIVAVSRVKRVRILAVEWSTRDFFYTSVNESGKKRLDKSKAISTLTAWATEHPKNDAMYDPSGRTPIDKDDDRVMGYDPEDINDNMICQEPSDEDESYYLPTNRKRLRVNLTLKQSVLKQIPPVVLDEDHDDSSKPTKDERFVAETFHKENVTALMLHSCLEYYPLEVINRIMVKSFGLWAEPGAARKDGMLTLIEEFFE
jgi:hypothetical protein